MLFIHIGFHKTGTTTIQSFAAANEARLAAAGVLYPKLGRVGGAHMNFTNQLRGSSLFQQRKGGLDDLRSLIDSSDKDVFISSEAFHILNPAQVERLARKLEGVETVIIVYVRPLSEVMVSSYMQNAKTGHFVENFDEFFESRTTAGVAPKGVYRGLLELQSWADTFGWRSLRIRTLDPEGLDGGDLLSDLVNALGLSWKRLGESQSTQSRNLSPGWKAVELIRSLQKAAGGLDGLREQRDYVFVREGAHAIYRAGETIAEELGLNFDRGNYLSAAQLEFCDVLYAGFIHELNARLHGSELRAGSAIRAPRKFLPEPDRVPVAERDIFYERMAIALAKSLREMQATAAAVAGPTLVAERDARAAARRQREQRGARPQARNRSRDRRGDTPVAGELDS